MNQGEDVEEAITALRGADGARRAALKAMQEDIDRRRGIFKTAMQGAEVSPDELRKTMLMNMTTRPHIHLVQLALTWMQSFPGDWQGWYPEQCEMVAQVNHIGEDV